MRVLLDENIPVGLAGLLGDHDIETVSGLGWSGVTNGELLRRMQGQFDALVTMDKRLPHQQNLAMCPFGVVLVEETSNRMVHLQPLAPRILGALDDLPPGALRRVGA
jgi:hypothetical protein